MTFKELVDDCASFANDTDKELIDEAKHTSPAEYVRHWHSLTDEDRKNGETKGWWVYDHKEVMGVGRDKNMVVHHIDHNKHNNNPSNLMVLTRKSHAIEDPNARKHFGCKVKNCKNEHYSHGLCHRHYMLAYRKGKFGKYDVTKNYSKKERKEEEK